MVYEGNTDFFPQRFSITTAAHRPCVKAPKARPAVPAAGGVDGGFRDLAAARPALADSGFLYLEAPRAFDAQALAPHRLELARHLKAGAVHGHLLRPVA